ncbi:DUF892 family protein [Flavobacterium sp.]|uniref:DUF892 family protein n=1 Tax=Flavobacterium sp. TaxID=239 RepID=UPI0024895D77|nr:DUF892 family protein [Flavobacterium sp.]MDI1317156.1 DUF892 family protein [Flavobacterium sp.]
MKNKSVNYNTNVNENQMESSTLKSNNSIENEILYKKSMIELREIYWYEKQTLIALKMIMSTAKTTELKEILTLQTKYIRDHIKKLEVKFPSINEIVSVDLNSSRKTSINPNSQD